jgi:hypothetical protein
LISVKVNLSSTQSYAQVAIFIPLSSERNQSV